MEEQIHPGRRTAGIAAGIAALVLAGGTAAIILHKSAPAPTPSPTPGSGSGTGSGGTPAPTPAPTPTAIFQITSAVIAGPVVANQYATATVIVKNVGQKSATITVAGLTTYTGQIVGHWVTITAPQVLSPGQTATFSLRSDGPIWAGYVQDTLQGLFALSNGAVTDSVPFTVAPPLPGTVPVRTPNAQCALIKQRMYALIAQYPNCTQQSSYPPGSVCAQVSAEIKSLVAQYDQCMGYAP